MSQTVITLAFERWKAQQESTGEVVLLDEFVFASVPGLDPAAPIDRAETLPPASQIVHRQAVTRRGVVNENAVVYSAVMGADVGDFSFNWIGLLNRASGTLAMIVHAPEQRKLKTKDGQQGNVLTRSFLMEYTGAQAETAINTPAETWQIDFTARMAGMDERQRLENMDIYGREAFFDDGWLVGKTGNQFFVTKGAGYVAGLRTELAANQNVTVTTKPVKIWLDVCWTGELTSTWAVQNKITVAESLKDYEQAGIQHYVFALASIDANGIITDLRHKGSLNSQASDNALKKHEKSRNHPDASLTAKGFVQLSNAVTSVDEAKAATPKAVKSANDNANNRVSKAGDKMTGRLDLPQTSAFGVNTDNALGGNSIAVGDSDTGIKQNGDGILDIYANGGAVCRYEYNNITAFKSVQYMVSGAPAGGGSFDEQLRNATAPFVQKYWEWTPTSGGFFVPLMKGFSARAGIGFSTAVTFGYLLPSANGFAIPCIHARGDNVDALWQFVPDDKSLRCPGHIYAGGASYQTDGNLSGSVWGGYLSTWLNDQFRARDNNINTRATFDWVKQYFVQDIRLSGESQSGLKPFYYSLPLGCVMTGLDVAGDSNASANMGYRALQKLVNDKWYNVGSL